MVMELMTSNTKMEIEKKMSKQSLSSLWKKQSRKTMKCPVQQAIYAVIKCKRSIKEVSDSTKVKSLV